MKSAVLCFPYFVRSWPTKSELRWAYYVRNHGFISTGYGVQPS
jgi:hypothetical protein